MPMIRVSKEFKSVLDKKRKRGESMERTLLNNMHPIDLKLKKIFDDQDKRRKKKWKIKILNWLK